MTDDEIHDMWSKEAKVDPLNIIRESANIPKLHHKYLQLLMANKSKHRKYVARMAQLKSLKTDYYSGAMDKKDLDTLGWEPFQGRVLKAEMPRKIEQDQDVIKLALMMGECQDTMYLLEEILKQISNRGFQIKSIVDWSRFENGM